MTALRAAGRRVKVVGALCLEQPVFTMVFVAIGAHAETDEAQQLALMRVGEDQPSPVRAHQ